MQIRVKREDHINAAINTVQKGAADLVRSRLIAGLRAFHQEVLARTPVHTGRAIANYQWTVGAPANGVVAHSSGSPIGQTNKYPLGIENRRDENEAIANASFAALDFSNPFKKFYLTNNTPYFNDLEYGRIPNRGSLKPRTPAGGIMRAAAKLIRSKRSF